MRIPTGDIAIILGPFIAEAAASGLRPPLRLEENGARAWPLLDENDVLVMDEYGDLWWARVGANGARVIRRPWPEEITGRWHGIERAVGELRARAAHPAGRR